MVNTETNNKESVAQLAAFRRHAEAYKTFKILFDRSLISSIGIYILQGGKFQFVNTSFQEVVGYTEKELLHLDPPRLVHPEDRKIVHENVVKMLKGEQKLQYEYRIVDKKGNIKWVLETVVSIQYLGKLAALGYFMDITDRKRSEEELANTRQQQLKLKDQFLSRVSHELRTPLATIHQFVTILLDGIAGELAPEQREYLEITLRNINQLHAMVADLLEVTRAQTGKLVINPRCFFVAGLIAETADTFRASTKKAVSLSVQLPNDLPPAYADPSRVTQILVNLINNGIQFTPEGGSITVKAEIFKENPDYLCVKVADTGYGISAEEKDRIFEYLYQAENNLEPSRRGLGLGLYICKELVSRQGGRIWFESELGHGSTFFFTLPIYPILRLLSPIFTKKNLQLGSVALITIEISTTEKRVLTETDKTASQDAWNVVRQCIPPSLAVSLPPMAHEPTGEMFFVVACTDNSQREVLFTQIQDKLNQCQSIHDAGLEPKTSFSVLDISASKKARQVKLLAKDIATHIEDLLRTT